MMKNYKYFIGNWKMFGDFSSLKIVKSVSYYINKINKKEIRVIFCIPNTLIDQFSNKMKNSKIFIGAQNCHYLESYGPHTGSVSPKMLNRVGAKYVILGHSENRTEGDTDSVINKKIKSAVRNNLTVIFCIGETLKERKQRKTRKVLYKQIDKGLKFVNNLKRIIVSYEPVWSIGTGIIPTKKELSNTIFDIRNKLYKKFKNKNLIKVIYGGSVNPKNIDKLSEITGINGFLVGGASQSGKKFIDIIRNCYM